MRSTAVAPVALVFVLSSCGPGRPEEPVSEAVCPVTEPILLAAAPPGFEPAEDAYYGVHVFGDDVLYTFDRFEDPAREVWRLNRCTGEVEAYPSLAPGLHNPYLADTAFGRVLYANDAMARPYVVDRFDEPGADVARPVPGLPDGVSFTSISSDSLATFFLFEWSGSSVYDAAGVGVETYAIYKHNGDPEVDALLLSDRLISAVKFDERHVLAHEDDGEVHVIDEATGERELVRTGVRYLSAFVGRTFIWQAMGDDAVEPVFLHRFDTDEDVQIAVNDFAALSWNRGEHLNTGRWVHSNYKEAIAAAMVGPDNRYVAAARLDTGAAIAVPEHLEQRGWFAGQFRILRASDAGEVDAFWDPRTGEVRDFHRHTSLDDRPILHDLDGDRVVYWLSDQDQSGMVSFWRVDLASGERERLLAGVGMGSFRLNETQFLEVIPRARLVAPPSSGPGQLVQELRDFALVDVVSGERVPIAARVSGRAGVAEGVLVMDAFGPEPGLWAHPLPYEDARSGARNGPVREIEAFFEAEGRSRSAAWERAAIAEARGLP